MRIYRVAVGVAVVGLLAGLVVASAAFAGGGGNSPNAKSCQKNGWWTLYRSDGTTFTSETACTSYAAKGGILRTAVADVSLTAGVGFGGGYPGTAFCATNAGPSSATITVQGQYQATFEGDKYTSEIVTQTLTVPAGSTIRLNSDFHFIGLSDLTGYAQVSASSAYDPDSTPNNYTGGFSGPAVEDDEAFVNVPDETPPDDC